MLFCNLSDFHCISTMNIQYMHSVFMFDQCVCVCGDLSLCACKVTLNYLHIIRCRNTVTENLWNEL